MRWVAGGRVTRLTLGDLAGCPGLGPPPDVGDGIPEVRRGAYRSQRQRALQILEQRRELIRQQLQRQPE